MSEWILPAELKEFIKTEFLKGVEKYKENPNAEHEYLKYRDMIPTDRKGDKGWIKKDL